MKSNRGTAGRIFSALAHAHVNVKMIDQGSSELNIIIGVNEADFESAMKAIYTIFVDTQLYKKYGGRLWLSAFLVRKKRPENYRNALIYFFLSESSVII